MNFRNSYTKQEEEYVKENANNALEYALSKGYELIKKGSYHVMKEHDSLVFTPDGHFYWNSMGVSHGNAITFIREYEGRSYKDAILILSGNAGYIPNNNVRKEILSNSKEKTPLKIPERAENSKIVFAYLIKTRGIDPQLVSQLVSERKLYQDKKYNNLVMVGFDEKNQPQYISKRSTNTTGTMYKLDSEGSDKSYPFVINGSRASTTVCVCESPIEAMSLWTLHKLIASPDKDSHIISLGGTSTNSLERFVKENPHIKNIIICTNKDEDKLQKFPNGTERIINAGAKCREKITEKYFQTHNVSSRLPSLNDWSDMLKGLRQNPLIKAQESHRNMNNFSKAQDKSI